MKEQAKIRIFQTAEKLLGRKTIEHWYLKRCVQIYIRNKLIYIHIPKAGGTSITHELLGQRAGHFSACKIREVIGPQAFSKILSLAVVRHPTDRLLSAYRYAKQGGGSEGGVRRLPVYSSHVFRSFESFVLEWLSQIDLLKAPIIFRPQCTFVCDENDHVIVQHVAHLERLPDLEIFLSEELGRPVAFDIRNTSEKEELLPVSMEVHQTILDLYRKDFDMFGYTPYTA